MVLLLTIVLLSIECRDIHTRKQNQIYSWDNFMLSIEPRLLKMTIFPVLKVM